jgi:hypothetical protein
MVYTYVNVGFTTYLLTTFLGKGEEANVPRLVLYGIFV